MNDPDLLIVQLNLKSKILFDSEIIIKDNIQYLPVKQISSIFDANTFFNRDSKLIKFTEPLNNETILIDLQNSTIKKGETILENEKVYWLKRGFLLNDEALISKELFEKLLNAKFSYNEEMLYINMDCERPLKILISKNLENQNSKEKAKKILIMPEERKANLKYLSASFFSYGTQSDRELISNETTNISNRTFNNSLSVQAKAQLFGGEYSIGPSFFLSQTNEIGLGGIRQSWTKKINDKVALQLGDSNYDLDLLSGGSQIFGLKVGSPDSFSMGNYKGLTFEGECSENSEVLLLMNEQLISRQLCKEGKYKFENIPRFEGNQNIYKLLQKNTDGSQIILSEENKTFYSELVPKNEYKWNASIGRPPVDRFLMNTLSTQNFSQDIYANKAIVATQFEYGLTDRMSLEASLSADQNIGQPNFNEYKNSSDKLPLSGDGRFMSGQVASFNLKTRPNKSLRFNTGIGVSNSLDYSENQLSRDGIGSAFFANYSFTPTPKVTNSSNQNRFFSYGDFSIRSPSFYNLDRPSGNRMNASMGAGISIFGQKINASLRNSTLNLDQKSLNGLHVSNTLNLSHAYSFSPKLQLQDNLSFRNYSDDMNNNENTNARASLNYKLNKKMSLNLSSGFQNQNTIKPEKNSQFLADATLGGHYFFDSLSFLDRKDLNYGISYFSNDTIKLFLEGRLKYKNLVFEPSASIFQEQRSTQGFSLGTALFWETENGSRLGFSYMYTKALTDMGTTLLSYQNENSNDYFYKTYNREMKNTNHTLTLSLFSKMGIVEKTPHIIAGFNSGFVKGKVFIDLNKNNIQDENEIAVPNITIFIDSNLMKTDENGEFIVYDLPEGTHKVQLDPLLLPATLLPLKETEDFLIAVGKKTEVSLSLSQNSATISGKVLIKDVEGKKINASNLLILANDSQGNEVAYTYSTDDGNYILSELPPGNYTISLDNFEIKSRSLTLEEPQKKVDISTDFNKFIQIKNVNFYATRSIF